jgi:cytochrome c-type biogenesis protein CcmH/NrfF
MQTVKTNRRGATGRRLLTTSRCIQVIAVVLFSVFFLGAGDDFDARVNALGHKKLICVCGCNQILLECNHVGCTYSDRMRNELIAAVQRGDSDDLVLQAFVQKYGPIVLAAPTTTGFNRIAWIMPFAVLLAGFALAGMIVLSWKKKPLLQPQTPGSSGPLEQFREQARRETEL